AVYVETETARWEGDTLRLDGGQFIRYDGLYGSKEAAAPGSPSVRLNCCCAGSASHLLSPAAQC
ncbi:MAG: hypothetical protein IPK19_26420, partial [Chloroflexi bacterium]|nr:hypothetical protein [Chloroflexota bacterium]